MSAATNKAIIRELNEELINRRNFDVRDKLVGSSFAVNGQIREPAQSREYLAMLFSAFPDFNRKIEDIFAEEDRVVTRYTATGTHRGEFIGVPATGKTVRFDWVAIYRIADGKVAEEWRCLDELGFMQQVGAKIPLE